MLTDEMSEPCISGETVVVPVQQTVLAHACRKLQVGDKHASKS